MIVALYARVSSDRQRQEGTINSQVQQLREFAAAQKLPIDDRHVYLDDGESGYYLDRPALDRLRDAARDGLIDIVLVQDPDRFSRKYAYQVLLLEEFNRWGARVRFLKQPPPDSAEQKLLVQIQGVISEYERARIMERTRRGRLFLARRGIPSSSRVPFGYRYIPRTRKEPARVEVDEEAAKIVPQIYSWYVEEGLSDRQIALRLMDRKVPPPKAPVCYWDPTTVSYILKNDSYLGTWYINRYKSEPRTGQASPRIVERPREEWIPITLPCLISAQLFVRAQDMRGCEGHQGPKPMKYPETHLLRRMVVCGPCGRKMTCHNSMPGGHRYYWCRGTDPHRIKLKARCPYPTVSAPALDDLVWSDIVSLLTDPQLILSAWREQNQVTGKQKITDEEIRKLKRQIVDGNNQRTRLLDAYEESAIELREFVVRRNAMDEKIAKCQMKLDVISTESKKGLSTADLTRNLDEVCRSLSKGLQSMSMGKKMKLCRKLIEKVVTNEHTVEIHYRFPVSSNFNNKGEGHQSFFPAGGTAQTTKSPRKQSAPQIPLELPLDERRVAVPVGAALAGLVEERRKVLPHHAVKSGSFGLAPAVGARQGPGGGTLLALVGDGGQAKIDPGRPRRRLLFELHAPQRAARHVPGSGFDMSLKMQVRGRTRPGRERPSARPRWILWGSPAIRRQEKTCISCLIDWQMYIIYRGISDRKGILAWSFR
jgi:site-specific DNA recombinase